jgi:heme oxygenase (mycobilin-producing)
MAITRIFRVRIVGAQRAEFEEKFSSVSIRFVNAAKGLIAVTIHKPTRWAPDEYSMISHWQDEASLETFVGKEWNRPKIPQGMEKLIEECWVHHYVSWA